jgi:hypothetical protein
MELSPGKEDRTEADVARLRYHLTSLYGLHPIPNDMLQLVQRLDTRLQTADADD